MATLEQLTSGAHATIDLDAYMSNIAALRSMLAPETAFMAVVKADAYGHGSVECARAAVAAGVEWLGVARIQEAMHLRRQGVAAPVLVIGPPNLSEIDCALERDISLVVGDRVAIDAVSSVAAAIGKPARVHLKIDTGMHRYGVRPEEALAAARTIAGSDALVLDGVLTHFSSADEVDPAPTDRQHRQFHEVVDAMRREGIDSRWRHTANSAAVIAGRAGDTNLVRCGIATYGLSPSPEVPVDDRFEPILRIDAVVSRVFDLGVGEGVSYGLTYRTEAVERVAAVSIGYADGLSRLLSNRGWFAVGGEKATIRGRICMDQTIISSPRWAKVGTGVNVIGPVERGAMSLDDAAELTGTNNYELATRLMARLPRLFVRGGTPVAWEHVLTGERGHFQ